MLNLRYALVGSKTLRYSCCCDCTHAVARYDLQLPLQCHVHASIPKCQVSTLKPNRWFVIGEEVVDNFLGQWFVCLFELDFANEDSSVRASSQSSPFYEDVIVRLLSLVPLSPRAVREWN